MIIRAQPGAKTSCVSSIEEEAVVIRIAAEPRDGKANTELAEYIAEIVKIKPRDIEFAGGCRSHDKVIIVKGVEPQALFAALKKEMES